MLSTEKVLLTATPNGALAGPLEWSSSSSAVCEVHPVAEDPTGLTAWAVGKGAGSVSINASEPARPDGSTPVSASITISVAASAPIPFATSLSIAAGTPVPQ